VTPAFRSNPVVSAPFIRLSHTATFIPTPTPENAAAVCPALIDTVADVAATAAPGPPTPSPAEPSATIPASASHRVERSRKDIRMAPPMDEHTVVNVLPEVALSFFRTETFCDVRR
jgi:uncharacterized membrane protein